MILYPIIPFTCNNIFIWLIILFWLEHHLYCNSHQTCSLNKNFSDPEYQNCQFLSHEFCGILKSFHMPYQINILKHKKCHTPHDEYGMEKKILFMEFKNILFYPSQSMAKNNDFITYIASFGQSTWKFFILMMNLIWQRSFLMMEVLSIFFRPNQ